MSPTKKLYYEDAYLKEFDAAVLSCTKKGDSFMVVLDRTCFYPEGGGQPADHGFLTWEREKSAVLDVQEDGDRIIHYTDCQVPEGSRVHGVIDWERRFDLMQQHSGEHIVSGMIHARYGYDNVGFHMGTECITIDLSGMLSEEEASEIFVEVNEYIWKDGETQVLYPDGKELGTLDYRSKKELSGQVRLVRFPGADLCACCGLHVRRAGEIGPVVLLSVKKFHQGVRIEMVSGGRALACLERSRRQNRWIAEALSVKDHETFDAVSRLLKEIYELKGELIAERKKQAESLAASCAGLHNAAVFVSGLDPVDIRKCTDRILDSVTGMGAVFSESGHGSYRYAAGMRDGDVRAFVKELNTLFDGRGGGKPFFAQGSLAAVREDKLRLFLKEAGFDIL